MTSQTMTSDNSQPPNGPVQEKPLPCPRCDSSNTKFCYYNNYNASQPRHFCKSCRRYWTHGGTLRDIPIGGGSRKRSRTWSSTAFPTSHDLFPTGPGLVSLGPCFGGRSFTSMISGVHGPGLFGLGNGFVEGLGFGAEKWPFADVGAGGGGGGTWQAESGGNRYVDNECLSTWPICAPGQQHGCLK